MAANRSNFATTQFTYMQRPQCVSSGLCARALCSASVCDTFARLRQYSAHLIRHRGNIMTLYPSNWICAIMWRKVAGPPRRPTAPGCSAQVGLMATRKPVGRELTSAATPMAGRWESSGDNGLRRKTIALHLVSTRGERGAQGERGGETIAGAI